MWFTIVSIFYVLVCAFLILVVLLQQGKGGGMGSAFGGGGGQTVFGGAGAGNFLTRLTAIAATLFMVLSAVLAYMSTSGDRILEAAEAVEASRTPDTVSAGGDGEEEGETPVAPPASEDTLEEAANDEVIDAIEQMVEAETGGAEPDPAALEDVAPEEAPAPAPEPEVADEAPAPAPRPRPAPAPAAEPEAPAEPAAE